MRQIVGKAVTASAILALIGLMSGTALGQVQGQSPAGAGAATDVSPGQQPPTGAAGAAAGVEPLVTFNTSLTFRSYSIAAGAAQGNLEGNSCGIGKMISGACHPFYNDRVTIINQFPNIPANTWRCGFKNNTAATVTVFIYTVCAQ
jgi:hypothetical protein